MSRLAPVKKIVFKASVRRDGNMWQGYYTTRLASTLLGFPDEGPVELSTPRFQE
ncbi:MAG: hypothetical protein WB780_03920 [Candidatus Acidiferrales bacterium]